MDTRWTLQVVLVAFVASSVAQNFQPQSGRFQQQATSNGFQSQRGVPQSFTQDQQDAFRAQDDFRKSVAEANKASILKPKRPQVQQSFVPTPGFSDSPQSQTHTRAQNPVRQQHLTPIVRHQQQPRQSVRPETQTFEQPQVPRQQQVFDQQQVQRQQFEQPQVQRQQFEQPQVQRQQFEQPQVQRLQFEQPTAQQVNQHYFNQPSQQNVEQPLEPLPVVVRRPAQDVERTQHPHHAQRATQSQYDQELFQHQAENARYSFAAAVTDTISDQQNVREETRDGLNLKGLYSYSDGYFKRTVHYEADENGYRVTKEEVEAIGDGPRGDPNGRAEVSSNVEGNNLKYSITSADIESTRSSQPLAQNENLPFIHSQTGFNAS